MHIFSVHVNNLIMNPFILILIFLSLFNSAVSRDLKIIQDRPTSLLYPAYWHTPFGIHRGTQEHLARFTNHATSFNQPQGLTCMPLITQSKQSQTRTPFQVTVVGVNQGEANLIYNPSLTELALIKSNHAFQLGLPADVAATRDQLVYLTDTASRQVHYFKPSAQRLIWQGCLEPPPSSWQQPSGIAYDSAGNGFISDKQANRIDYYNSQNQFIKSIGPSLSHKIRLLHPQALAVSSTHEPWNFYNENCLFICDQDGTRLIKTTLDGQVLNLLTVDQLGSSPAAFAWIALDYYNNLWATAPAEDKVYKFDHHLNFLTSVGKSGEGDYLFNHPTGIAIHRHFGQVFVAEKNAVHYFWIGADIEEAKAVSIAAKNRIRLTFFLTEPAFVSITTLAPVKTIYEKKLLMSGPCQVNWPASGDLDKNKFTAEIVAEATYSTRTHFAKRVVVKLEESLEEKTNSLSAHIVSEQVRQLP